MLHDFGSIAGFRAHVSYQPRRRLGVAAFVNDSTLAFPLVDAIANYVYDRAVDRDEATRRLDRALRDVATRGRQTVAAGATDQANRAKRQWTLTRPREAYTGTYESDVFGRVEIELQANDIQLRCGVLRSIAEPFTQPDSMRVEITPGSGAVIQFESGGPRPAAMILQGQRLVRTT